MTDRLHPLGKALAARLLSVTTNDATREVIKEIQGELDFTWCPVGGNPSNDGPIELGKDAPTQLIERVVNGIEACFELEARLHARDRPGTPAEAGARWFGLPPRGVTAMKDDKKVRSIAEGAVHVHLTDSGDPDRPTILVEDHGMGQHPSAFSTSLLSLHQSKAGEAVPHRKVWPWRRDDPDA